MRKKNRARGLRGHVAINAYTKVHGWDDDRTLLVDLLADLKHWATAKLNDVDLEQIEDVAQRHFAAEVLGIDD